MHAYVRKCMCAHACTSHYLTQLSPNVSLSLFLCTYICHMAILLRCLGKQHSKLKVHCSDHCSDRQPFVRNDFIPNGVLPISHVPRSWKIVIYMSASRCSLKNKNKQNIGRNPIEQFCNKNMSILLRVRELQCQENNNNN